MRNPSRMKTAIVLTLIFPVLCIFFSLPALATGRLLVSPLQYDTGILDEGIPAVMKAEIKNIGDQAVHIKNVRTN